MAADQEGDERGSAGARENFEPKISRAIEQMAEQIDIEFKSNPFRALTKRFVIAAASRSGSHLLCQQLLTHGAVAKECFAPLDIIEKCIKRGLPGLQAYCEHHLQRNTPRGIFGVKGLTDVLAPLVCSGEFPEHRGDWKFVHLKRMDRLNQAISLIIAKRTLAWRSFAIPVRQLGDDDFDEKEIKKTMHALTSRDREWEEAFQLFQIEPLRITYEDLAADPETVSADVAGFLGLHGPPIAQERFQTPPLEVQASELNARWRERYLALAG